ncbi:hypothetical protein EJB05_24782, partial [Eragrostis curvula]
MHPKAEPAPPLPDDVIVEHILTRVPAAAAVRFRTVCRAWRAALTSDHFVMAHHRALRAVGQPEIVFFAPRPGAGGSGSTAFYTCKLDLATQPNGSSSPLDKAVASASELVTVGNMDASHLVLSGTKPCRGLTLLFQLHPCVSTYHVCNLSTGEHVSIPAPRTPAERCGSYIHHPCYVLSSTGLGFDPVAGEHKVVTLYEDRERQQRCEVYGLQSGGWRPCAGKVPPHAANGLVGRPPVFLDGCFYWHIDTLGNLYDEYKLWTRTAGPGSPPPSWSLRLCINLASLPQPMRDHLDHGTRMLPLACLVRRQDPARHEAPRGARVRP